MEIDQQTIAEIAKLGGQYALPAAALLRAIYSGWKGKLPEGIGQITAASVLTGVTAVADGKSPDITALILELLGNTVFMAGLLTFIMVYLLRTTFGMIVDAIIGGILGGIFWAVWVLVLGNPWPVWTIVLTVIAGGAAFIALRFGLGVISTLVRIATYLIIIAVILIVGAGGLWLLQTYVLTPPAM